MTRRLFAGAVLGVLAQLSSVGLLLTSAWLIVRAAEHPPVLYLMVAIVSVRFFGVGRAVFRYAERLLTHDAALRMATNARVEVYRELERVAPRGLPRQRRGDVVSRVVGDVDAIQDQLLRVRLPWLYALTSATCVIVLLTFIEPRAGLILAAHVAGSALFVRVGLPDATRDTNAAELSGTMSAEASALALTSRDLVAFGSAHAFGRDIRDAIDRLAAAQRRSTWVGGLGSAYVLVSTGVAVALLAFAASGAPPVVAGVLLLAPVALLEPLEALADAERLRPTIESARRRLDELAVLAIPDSEPLVAASLPVGSQLAVEDLAVGWNGTIACHISFELDQGDVVGLSGPSGVGKSTLALTLAKLVPPRAGRISLGGVDYADLDGAAVRSRLGLSGQDDVLFDTTIRENLRIADPAADDRAMHSALRRARLDEFVRDLPRGLDTPVGEHGSELSGGERTRLALARLILGRHRLLVFDEPTEHLDRPTAEALLDDIHDLARDHAVLIISHSSTVLASCDRVVELRDARQAELVHAVGA